MNSDDRKASRAERKVSMGLGLLLAFVVVSNFSTWKANMTTPRNMQASVIGGAIQRQLSRSEEGKSGRALSLDANDILHRIVISQKAQPYLALPFADGPSANGNIDEAIKIENGWKVGGWTYVPETAGSAEFVVAVENEKIISVLPVDVPRQDVANALSTQRALRTGYSGLIISQSGSEGCKLVLYTLTSSLRLFTMQSICDKANHSAQ